MQLFLVRHGETEHNVAGLLAGVTDSNLTNHGVLQAQRLGSYLIGERKLRFTHVYASDLRRASMTAQEICKAQNSRDEGKPAINVVELELLREQDFGSFELVAWSSKRGSDDTAKSTLPSVSDPDFRPKETKQAMALRACDVLDDFIFPLLALDDEEESCVAVVSHGLFLGSLWRTLLSRFGPRSLHLAPDAKSLASGRSLEHLGSWTNTGYLELRISATVAETTEKQTSRPSDTSSTKPSPPKLQGTMVIKSINTKHHLQNLKRARGGLGSATHDERQSNIDGFFKKSKTKATASETTTKKI